MLHNCKAAEALPTLVVCDPYTALDKLILSVSSWSLLILETVATLLTLSFIKLHLLHFLLDICVEDHLKIFSFVT